MTYILKKKWHPSQVEEVGHVFAEKCNTIYYESKDLGFLGNIALAPHEIALLVDAGYLKKKEDCGCYDEQFCKICRPDLYQNDHTLDLWTTEPPELTVYWCIILNFKEDDPYRIFKRFFQKNSAHSYFDLETNNCHKTYESVEEALKRLLA